jgi:LacI family transcriptional regulator
MGVLLQRAGRRLTAVFAHNDYMAIGAIQAMKEHGIRCPEDMSVIGYNDSPLVDRLSPALTTIRLPAAEVGALAGESVIKAIEHPQTPPVSAWIPPSLVVRASTAPPPHRG